MTPTRPCLVAGAAMPWGADDVRDYLAQHAAVAVSPYPFARDGAEMIRTADGVLSALPLPPPRGWTFGVRTRPGHAVTTYDIAEAVRLYLEVTGHA